MFNLPLSTVLKLIKRQCDLTESGDSWFNKYTSYLNEKLNIRYTPGDLSFFYHNIRDEIQGLLAVYVDDKLAAEVQDFMKLTNKIPEKFETKPREFPPLIFAGVMSNPDPGRYILEQNAHSNQIEKLPEDCDFDILRTTSHRLIRITQTRPEILEGLNILSQINEETYRKEDTKTINCLINHLRKYPNAGLR